MILQQIPYALKAPRDGEVYERTLVVLYLLLGLVSFAFMCLALLVSAHDSTFVERLRFYEELAACNHVVWCAKEVIFVRYEKALQWLGQVEGTCTSPGGFANYVALSAGLMAFAWEVFGALADFFGHLQWEMAGDEESPRPRTPLEVAERFFQGTSGPSWLVLKLVRPVVFALGSVFLATGVVSCAYMYTLSVECRWAVGFLFE